MLVHRRPGVQESAGERRRVTPRPRPRQRRVVAAGGVAPSLAAALAAPAAHRTRVHGPRAGRRRGARRQRDLPGGAQADGAVLPGERRARQDPRGDLARLRRRPFAAMPRPASPRHCWPRLRRWRLPAIRWYAPTGAGAGPPGRSRSTARLRAPWACTRSLTGLLPRRAAIAFTIIAWCARVAGTTGTRVGSTRCTCGYCPRTPCELTAAYLDLKSGEILARRPHPATPLQRQHLAAVVHLCGAGAAAAVRAARLQLPAGGALR